MSSDPNTELNPPSSLTSPLLSATIRQPTPQLSGENTQMIEAKAELSRVVAQYGFSVVSQAWDWLVVDHNMETGEMLVDPSRSLDPPFAFTPPLMAHYYHHPDFQMLRLPTPALETQHQPSTTTMMHEFQVADDEPHRYTPIVEFQFVVSTEDDDDDEESKR